MASMQELQVAPSLIHKKQAAATFNSKIALMFESSSERRREEKLKKYCIRVSYMLGTYATDEHFAQTHAKLMRVPQALS